MARINAVSFHENPSIEAICRKIRAAGFDSVELSRPPFYHKLTTPGTRAAFAGWLADLGLSMYGFDAWVEVDPYTAARGHAGKLSRRDRFCRRSGPGHDHHPRWLEADHRPTVSRANASKS